MSYLSKWLELKMFIENILESSFSTFLNISNILVGFDTYKVA